MPNLPNFSSHYPILSQQSLFNIIDKTKKGWEKNLTWISCHCINTLILKQMWLLLGVSGEDNGTPLQCSSLENPRDGGTWWSAVYGVAQSQTWLKWLSSSRVQQLPSLYLECLEQHLGPSSSFSQASRGTCIPWLLALSHDIKVNNGKRRPLHNASL